MANNLENPIKGLVCVECKTVYQILPADLCERCFSPVVPLYNPQKTGTLKENIIAGPKNLFRYEPLIPAATQPCYDVGLTELIRVDELAKALGIEKGMLYVKFDEGSVTKTFKDRGAVIVAQLVSEFNAGVHSPNGEVYKFEALGGSSTGNLASAITAAAALIGLKSIVFVHSNADKRLVDKALSFGGYVLQVMADYSEVNDKICKPIVYYEEDLASKIAWVNLTLRPLYSQGAKTIGFEIAEQLGWKSPDNIVHPVAAGLSFWQIYTGLKEFERFGLIGEVKTQMHAAQPFGCKPVVEAWRRGEPFEIMPAKNPKSVAETLCVGNPSNGLQVLETIKNSNGSAIDATDPEIEEGMNLFYNTTGLRAGPVGGTVVAATKKLMESGVVKPDELSVLVITDSENHEIRGNKKGKLFVLEPDYKLIKRTLENILAE